MASDISGVPLPFPAGSAGEAVSGECITVCRVDIRVTAGRARSRLEQCTTQHDENNSVYVRVCTPLATGCSSSALRLNTYM